MNAAAGYFPHPITRTRRQGFGLLETILVFAVVIGAAAVAFTMYESAQRQADIDHDRTLIETLGANLGTVFHPPWNAANGPTVQNLYYQYAAELGGSSCTSNDQPQQQPGCLSNLSGQPLGVGETDTNGSGVDFSVTIQNLPDVATCAALLAGGPSAFGSVGFYTQGQPPFTWAQPKTQADVLTWCQSIAAGDGTVADVEIYYGEPAPTPAAAPPSDPGLPPGWPPGLPPPAPGYTP